MSVFWNRTWRILIITSINSRLRNGTICATFSSYEYVPERLHMLLAEWRKTWKASRAILEDAIEQILYTDSRGNNSGQSAAKRISDKELEIFRKFGILPRSSLELCATDDNAWMWILSFLNELGRSGKNIAYMLPQRSESMVQLSLEGFGNAPCTYSVKGRNTLTSLAIRLMSEKACDFIVFSPSALDMKLLRLPAEGSLNDDAYNIAFGRAVMALSHAAELYGVPVIFLRRMSHRNDSRGLSAVKCRIRIRSAAGRCLRIFIDKDTEAEKMTYSKPVHGDMDFMHCQEMKYMLDI